MPEHTGGDRAPWSPALSDRGHFEARRPRGQPLQLAGGLCERDVTERPDIRPAEHHDEIDVCGPGTNPLDRGELAADLVVLEPGQPSELKVLVEDRPRQIAAVFC